MLKWFDKPSIYFILGTPNAKGRNPLMILEEALAGGIHCFQLREKGADALTGQALTAFAKDCKRLCQKYGVPLIINDRVDLAQQIDADGVHIGQEDAKAITARHLLGADKVMGVSVHSLAEAEKAVNSGADYVGIGPVFGTHSKADAKKPAGTDGILTVKSRYPELPVIGIGGITPDNAGLVWSAGADGVAMISSLAEAEDIAAQIERFKASMEAGAGK